MRAAILGVAALVGLAACSDEPRVPRAGQVVKPLDAPAFPWVRVKVPTVSLYEYYDKQHDRITGKSISFKIPRPYFVDAANFNGGPQGDISVELVQRQSAKGLAFLWIPQRYQAANSDAETVSLKPWADRPDQITLTDIENEVFVPNVYEQGASGKLHRGAADYCGYQTFLDDLPIRHHYPTQNLARRDPSWTFDRTVAFAKPTSSQAFYPVVACSRDIHSDGFPLCTTDADYRGWPLSITFSGRKLCDTEGVIAGARLFLDEHRVRETERAPGFQENRHGARSVEVAPGVRVADEPR